MFIENWTEFKKAAESVYLKDPDKVRCSLKYDHKANLITLKVTDNAHVLQYKTEQFNEYKMVENFVGELMTQMTAK